MQIVKIWRSIVLFTVLACGFAVGATQFMHAPTAMTILAGDDTKGAGGGG